MRDTYIVYQGTNVPGAGTYIRINRICSVLQSVLASQRTSEETALFFFGTRRFGNNAHVWLRFFGRPQDPEGEPLMLDRFDARWMLDLADFSKGFGSPISTALAAEVGDESVPCVAEGGGGRELS